jgi:hypothetical protein
MTTDDCLSVKRYRRKGREKALQCYRGRSTSTKKLCGFRPGETWLLKRLLAHAWEYGSEAYLSLRRLTFEANISRKTLQTYVTNLERLGYVRFLSDGNGSDKRWRYDVTGAYGALALCIAADPTSAWAAEHGGALPIETVRRKRHSGPHGKKTPVAFDLDFAALAALAGRKGEDLVIPEDCKPRQRVTRSYAELGGDGTAEAFAVATGIDYSKHKRRLMREVKLMADLEPALSAALVHEHYIKKAGDDNRAYSRRKTWWYRSDPRGCKGEAPTINAIRETWGKWQQ